MASVLVSRLETSPLKAESIIETTKQKSHYQYLALFFEQRIFLIIPLRAGIRVKFHSQFSPNSTGQQCNLEEAVRFEPNPPRAV